MLNINAPLLPTRRLGNSGGEDLQGTSLPMSERIPFSWERAPAKPKDSNTGEDIQPGDTPRLKLPPGWWHRPLHKDNECDHELDDGWEGDIDLADVEDDIDDVDYGNEAFSDAIDLFSLSEAVDIVEKKEQREHETTDHSLKLKSCRAKPPDESNCIGCIIYTEAKCVTNQFKQETLLSVELYRDDRGLCFENGVRAVVLLAKGLWLAGFLPLADEA